MTLITCCTCCGATPIPVGTLWLGDIRIDRNHVMSVAICPDCHDYSPHEDNEPPSLIGKTVEAQAMLLAIEKIEAGAVRDAARRERGNG